MCNLTRLLLCCTSLQSNLMCLPCRRACMLFINSASISPKASSMGWRYVRELCTRLYHEQEIYIEHVINKMKMNTCMQCNSRRVNIFSPRSILGFLAVHVFDITSINIRFLFQILCVVHSVAPCFLASIPPHHSNMVVVCSWACIETHFRLDDDMLSWVYQSFDIKICKCTLSKVLCEQFWLQWTQDFPSWVAKL